MKRTTKHVMVAGAVALALGSSGIVFADDSTNSNTQPPAQTKPMTGKQKATAIGAGTGAVAGAVVGGPVGAVVGGVAGAYIGNKGTDANGRVDGNARTSHHAYRTGEDVREVQVALNNHGYNLAIDGVFGPATESALRDFQAKNGLASTGAMDDATKSKLGVA